MRFDRTALITLFLVTGLVPSPLFAVEPPAAPVSAPEVRVLVAENQASLKLSVKGGYRVRLLPTLELIAQGQNASGLTLVPTANGIRIGAKEWAGKGVRIEQLGKRDLVLNKSRFRGSLDVLRTSDRKLSAVNRLDVESYLYGVLNYEVSAWWPMEALKAQAIAARTYALYQASVSRTADYDLKSGTSSQVYGGSTRERARTMSAVDQTRGAVLTYQGKMFPAYFHATCAGKTAASDELWKITLPPLGGGVLCGFCKISPHYVWKAEIPFAEIEEKLAKNGRPVGRVIDFRAVTRTPSDRVGSLKITGTDREAVIAAKDFRIWIGGDRMRSTAFFIRLDEDMALLAGRGWGHGVGLCQWGTLGQALLGRKHWEILRFYYRDSTLMKKYARG